MDFLIFISAMAALVYGASLLTKYSEQVALKQGISTYIISATLIAIGTSLPEIAASIFASLDDKPSIAVANVIGSTVFNTAFVIGIVFLIAGSIHVKKDIFKEDAFWIVIPVIFFILLGFDEKIDFVDGLLFLTIMIAFLWHLISANQLDEFAESEVEEGDLDNFSWGKTIFFLVLGFAFVLNGANFAIDSASSIARDFGISEWVVGIFLVAFGTSLPELVVGIVAAVRKQADMLVGTIIGSNIANFSIVLGLSSLVNDLTFSLAESAFDITLSCLCVVAFLFVCANKMYNRAGGLILFAMSLVMIYESIKTQIV